MKRREEIEGAAKQKYPYEGGIKGLICENSIPIFIQAAEWADKTMIDKVCDWLKARNVLTEESLEGFRKAMEE